MTRISDLAAHNQVTRYMLDIQDRVHDAQLQVSSEKISQDYQGISLDSNRLVTLENSVTSLTKYQANNATVDLRLSTAESAMTGIESVITDFRKILEDFKQAGSFDESEVEDVQDWAFRSMKLMQGYLNTEADGRYIFSGTRVTTKPVDLGTDTLAAFQTTYDGETTTYPHQRDGHLQDAVTLLPADTGNLTFTAGPPGTIAAATAGGFTGLHEGATITISGSSTNDGTYTIASIDGTSTTITLNPTVTLNAAGPEAITSVSTSGNYYDGDQQPLAHRVDENQSFEFDVNATNAAFEKAIRAMGIIAQGDFGTAGGLDQNQGRVDDALYLLDSSLDPTTSGTPPYGAEDPSNLESLAQDTAFDRILIDNRDTYFSDLIGFFEGRIAEIENVDPLDAITRMLDDSRALEASYQALAKIRSLTLSDYI